MTTLVILTTMDSVVLGCDSLGTATRPMIDPSQLVEFFDPSNAYKLKVDQKGEPLLTDITRLYPKFQEIPASHMTHVDKLFSLSPLDMGVMFAGITSVGDRTVKSLVDEFKNGEEFLGVSFEDYTLEGIGESLLKFIGPYYLKQYPLDWNRPALELMIGGYDGQHPNPGVARIDVHLNKVTSVNYGFWIYLGGQSTEIERIVFGTDSLNLGKMKNHELALLNAYHALLTTYLQQQGSTTGLPKPEALSAQLKLVDWSDLNGLASVWEAFSEQNAIDCVDFLVTLMAKSQQFSPKMPTVGGEVNIAIVRRTKGFTFVSKRELRHGDNVVPLDE